MKAPRQMTDEISINPEDTKQRILVAAAELFSSHGFKGTTIRKICDKANANVASVKYYYASKSNLYIETCRFLFQQITASVACHEVPIRNHEEWENELYHWAYAVLSQMTANSPLQLWRSRLFARERTTPSEVLPIVYEQFMAPVLNRLDELLKMALPPDVSEDELKIWNISTVGQCTVYAQREAPWDEVLFPHDLGHEVWLQRVSRHVVTSITARLHFRGHDAT